MCGSTMNAKCMTAERREISVVYATGYKADIRGIGHKHYIRGIKARGYPQISVVYDPRKLARILAHSA